MSRTRPTDVLAVPLAPTLGDGDLSLRRTAGDLSLVLSPVKGPLVLLTELLRIFANGSDCSLSDLTGFGWLSFSSLALRGPDFLTLDLVKDWEGATSALTETDLEEEVTTGLEAERPNFVSRDF